MRHRGGGFPLRRHARWVPLLMLLTLLTACGPAADEAYRPTLSESPSGPVSTYVVGIHPLHNPQRLIEVYGPIIDRINAGMPAVEFRVEASRNYEEFERKLFAGYFAFALPNPYQTVRALRHGYHVFGRMGDDEDFRGLILVRKDGPVHAIADLKGRSVAYPAASALAATMLPQHFLQSQGIQVMKELDNRYVGSQESAIVALLRGHVAAAATWPVPWRAFQEEHPQEAAQLSVKWQTETLPNNAWVAREDVPPADVRRFAELLFGLKDSADGRALLQRVPVTQFEPANDDVYLPVKTFLEAFSQRVRPIDF